MLLYVARDLGLAGWIVRAAAKQRGSFGSSRARSMPCEGRRSVSSKRSTGRVATEPRRGSCGRRSASPVCDATKGSRRGRDRLASVCDRFTEGFGTADLREAKRLIDALS
jgi:hypothetical protein